MTGDRIVGGALLVMAILFFVYGSWQAALGRNLPGVLSWSYLPRDRSRRKSPLWSRARWRINGVVLIAMALFLGWNGLVWLHR